MLQKEGTLLGRGGGCRAGPGVGGYSVTCWTCGFPGESADKGHGEAAPGRVWERASLGRRGKDDFHGRG